LGIQVGDINESSPTVADGSSRAGPDPIDIVCGGDKVGHWSGGMMRLRAV